MSAAASAPSLRLERLAAPLVPSRVAAEVGDIVRLAQTDGAWFYCRVEDLMPQGDLVCSVVDAQWWPRLMIDGIRPGVSYVVAPDNVLSVVTPRPSLRTDNPRPAG